MQPLNKAVPGALAELLASAPLSPGKVECAWRAAVGPALQRVTAVRLEAGRLLVDAVDGNWAREVSRASHIILPRLQLLLGGDVVHRIEVRANR